MIARHRLINRRSFVAGCTAAAIATPASPQAPPGEPAAIALRVHRIDHFKVGDAGVTRFGDCVFRGGLELSSSDDVFGGLSGIAVDADGQGFLAITDVGSWLQAKIVYEGQRPVGLSNCLIAPMLKADGGPLKRSKSYDAESLCLDGGVAYVGVERVHEVLRFDWAKDRFKARGRPISVPPLFRKLPHNRGCEGLGVAPRSSPIAGSLVAISERSGARNEPTRGFILIGAQRGEFELVLKNEFDATDLAFLPNGDMLVLERYYRPFRGVGMRIRRIDGAAIKPGARLDGPAVIQADLSCQIDNMEALGVHRGRDGETVLTILSDDNFSIFQRTLLLQFTLAPGP